MIATQTKKKRKSKAGVKTKKKKRFWQLQQFLSRADRRPWLCNGRQKSLALNSRVAQGRNKRDRLPGLLGPPLHLYFIYRFLSNALRGYSMRAISDT